MAVECYRCGRVFRKVCELKNVRGFGLALVGECPKCGTSLGINDLWRCTRRIDERENVKPSKDVLK